MIFLVFFMMNGKFQVFHGNISVLNKDGVFLDITDWNIRDRFGNILYTPLVLPSEYYDWALQYLQNVIYSTEDLRKLIEREFVTENEEALQIARDSLENTRVVEFDSTIIRCHLDNL